MLANVSFSGLERGVNLEREQTLGSGWQSQSYCVSGELSSQQDKFPLEDSQILQ